MMSLAGWKRHLPGILAGTVYGLIARWVFGLGIPGSTPQGPKSFFVVMSYAFVFAVPLVIGFLTVNLGPIPTRRKWLHRIFMPWISCLLAVAAAVALAWEGAICVIIGGPLILVLGSLGGIFAGLIADRWKRRGLALASFVFLPFLVSPLERQAVVKPEFRTVTTLIAVDADPETVWNQLVRVPEIRPEERRASFFHRIGIPKPLEATLSREGIGGVREARFEKGIIFREMVTEWEQARRLGFTIRVDLDTIRPDALDEHVRVGGEYIDVLDGRFEIEPKDAGGVLLRLTSTHRLSTRFNFYSAIWSDWIMQDIQKTICRVIKDRSEHE